MNEPKKKVCVVTCYKHPDYVRGEVIRQAVRLNPGYELVSVKNKHKNFLRYAEVLAKLVHTRIFKRPDLYIVTFRGYEILPLARIVTMGKRLIFDEFINLVEWTVYEHKKIKAGSFQAKLLLTTYTFWLKRAGLILTDTASHAEYSSKLTGINRSKYGVLPVGADETVFVPTKMPAKSSQDSFDVLYYGNMLPLHGAEYVLEAAEKLKAHEEIHFTLIGGKADMKSRVETAKARGANVTYIDWLPLKKLPAVVERSSLCLGGPFGKTLQSDMVITGKTFQFMALSKPALIGRNKESGAFKDKHDCIIVEQGNADDLAKQIKWAFEHRSELKKIGQNGHGLYMREFSLEKLSVRLSGLID